MWWATVSRQVSRITKYHLLDRNKSLCFAPDFCVSFTFAYTLFNVRMEYNRLLLRDSRLTAVMVADAFSGNEKYKSSSLKQMAHMAIRSPKSEERLLNMLQTERNPIYVYIANVLTSTSLPLWIKL